MNNSRLTRAIKLAKLFIKEQLKEPVALFWILLSPSAVFYLLAFSKEGSYFQQDYLNATAWFYAYLSLSVAFFGFSFYIIGRRESGFIRSFIYTQRAKTIFLTAQFTAYSLISILYCVTFYLATKLSFGPYSVNEAATLLFRFYCCFVLFCTPGLLLTLLPLNFQTANTVFAITSFAMLALGVAHAARPDAIAPLLNTFNLLMLGNEIMLNTLPYANAVSVTIFFIFCVTAICTHKYLRINPVWSRY